MKKRKRKKEMFGCSFRHMLKILNYGRQLLIIEEAIEIIKKEFEP